MPRRVRALLPKRRRFSMHKGEAGRIQHHPGVAGLRGRGAAVLGGGSSRAARGWLGSSCLPQSTMSAQRAPFPK